MTDDEFIQRWNAWSTAHEVASQLNRGQKARTIFHRWVHRNEDLKNRVIIDPTIDTPHVTIVRD